MVHPYRETIHIYLNLSALTVLSRCLGGVAFMAQTFFIAVIVCATLRKSDDVVNLITTNYVAAS